MEASDQDSARDIQYRFQEASYSYGVVAYEALIVCGKSDIVVV